MADIRELVILSPGILDPTPEGPLRKSIADLRMAVRRVVVRLARLGPFRRFFGWMYDAHVALAVAVGKRFPGTQAIYLTSGLATGDRNIGISDVDIAMYGNWPDQEQFRLLKVFGALTVLLPLFDRRSLGSINTLEDIHALCATDLHMAMNYERGRREWKLLYGDPVLDGLPRLDASRWAGAVYANLRRWWSELAVTTCGTGVISRDSIFVRTICYKAAAEIVRNERMLAGGVELASRRILLQAEYQATGEPVLGRLLASADAGFLDRDGDPRTATMAWMLQHAERMHQHIRSTPPFTRTNAVTIVGGPSGRVIAPGTQAHVDVLLAQARSWSGFRSAFLVPIASMFSPDGLGLLLEVDSENLPSREQLQALGALHSTGKLSQRVALFLLLPNAAYMLDSASALEFFHYTLCPESNPEVVLALSDADYLLAGTPRPAPANLGWTPFMAELFDEELTARRGAYRRFGLVSRPSALENLRNFVRFLQLTLIESTVAAGSPAIPVTVPAVLTQMQQYYPQFTGQLTELGQAYRSALQTTGFTPAGIEAPMTAIYRELSVERNDGR